MKTENAGPPPHRPSLLQNWMSLTGLVVEIGGLFSFFLLFMLDAVGHFSNPYISILTWMVTPAFLVFGFILTVIGVLRERRRRAKTDSWMAAVQIDLSRPRDRRILITFVISSLLFIMLSAVGSYNAFNFTESVQFCGETCHGVMKPELTTHDHGPHARVACVACHVGPGVGWFVRSKLSGSYQVYSVTFNKYPRPIGTPIKNLRPSRETCEQCHWPQKFVGNLDRTYNYFQNDASNSLYSIRLSIKIGGDDPAHGPVGGIHWHMMVNNQVEYIATDAARQKIPWVRITDSQGVVTVYRTPKFTNDVSKMEIRKMDCMDCHNRPSHTYDLPERAVDRAMFAGDIPADLPFAKKKAVEVLKGKFATREAAASQIPAEIVRYYQASYPAVYSEKKAEVDRAAQGVLAIWERNVFPQMKVTWGTYPNNVGHTDFPGCFRCHDGAHNASDGRSVSQDCGACHNLLAMDEANPKVLTDLGIVEKK